MLPRGFLTVESCRRSLLCHSPVDGPDERTSCNATARVRLGGKGVRLSGWIVLGSVGAGRARGEERICLWAEEKRVIKEKKEVKHVRRG